MVFYAVVLLGFMAVMSVTDLRQRRLPNALVGAGAAAWLGMRLAGLGPAWGSALAAAGVAALLFAAIFMFVPQAMGGGDVKLAAVMGLYLGWPDIVAALLVGFGTAAMAAGVGMLLGRLRPGDTLPLAPFLTVGVVWATWLAMAPSL